MHLMVRNKSKIIRFNFLINCIIFVDAGQLRQINPKDNSITNKSFKFEISDNAQKNQQNYEAMGDVITKYVYELLLEIGLKKIHIPSDVPNASFVFGTKTNFANTKKLLILIHGSGVVRAGQWSRSLIINQSLDHGTQIPYIKRAIAEGYDVLVTNTNHNSFGSKTPEDHIVTVWKHLIEPVFDSIECFAIVAHSYGGIVTLHLAEKYSQALKDKCFAVGFTDSVHSVRKLERFQWFKSVRLIKLLTHC